MKNGRLKFLLRSFGVRKYFSRSSDRLAPVRMTRHSSCCLTTGLAVLAAMTVLVSCKTTELYKPATVEYSDEAGGVLLAVNSVSRWEQVADAMQPKFTLASGEAALSKVLPVTARLQQQMLDAFGLSLGLGLPQSFRESVRTRTANESQTSTVAGDQTTNSGTSGSGYSTATTATTKPGAAPTAPTGTPAGGELPSATAPGSDLGLDPLMQYRAAASLYQAVQLINREVELAAKREGYVPYMVRMQLTTIPYRRHMPYDVHSQVEFFPATKTLPFRMADGKTRLPYVVPLIVTDDLEQAINSRAAEVARQLGLALNFMMQGVGGNIGANLQSRDRESIFAADINSLLTVARLNDNGIYIRLGAANEATGRYSMVGRTYDIALLLLVPSDYFNVPGGVQTSGQTGSELVAAVQVYSTHEGKEPRDCRPSTSRADTGGDRSRTPPITLSVISHTDLRDASSGAVVEEKRPVTLVEQVDSAFKRTLGTTYKQMYDTWSRTAPEVKLKIRSSLVAPIQTSQYASFYSAAYSIVLDPNSQQGAAINVVSGGKCEIQATESNPRPEENEYRLACISEGYLRSLWTYLASTLIEGSTKSASFELPVLPGIVIPTQTALLRDDGKEKLEVVMRQVSGITSGGISAKLSLYSDRKCYEFPAEAILPNQATETLTLQFPSPAKWKLGEIDFKRSCLTVEARPCDLGPACAGTRIASPFDVLHAAVPPEKSKPGFDLRTTIKEIVVDKGSGTVKLVFDNFKDDSAELTWSGAEVKSAKNSNGDAVEIKLDKITVKATTVLMLEIQNAKPDGKVTFTAVGKKGDKKTGEETKEFSVVAGK
jgi:hypothetical protein